jgi:hypothetical protein
MVYKKCQRRIKINNFQKNNQNNIKKHLLVKSANFLIFFEGQPEQKIMSN